MVEIEADGHMRLKVWRCIASCAWGTVFPLDVSRSGHLTGRDGSPNRRGKGINREHGADDPRRGQDRGCPRNCKRIAVHPRGAVRRHATVDHPREGRWTADIREPGDLPSSLVFRGRGWPRGMLVLTRGPSLPCAFRISAPPRKRGGRK